MSEKLLETRRADLRQKFNVFVSNVNWINSNIHELKSNFPDTYIAVHDRRIVKTDKKLKNLKKQLKERGLNHENVTIEFIASKPLKLLV